MPRADMILDTNVFIESKNRYYAMDICPGFWEFLEDDFKAGRSMSITHVRAEILIGEMRTILGPVLALRSYVTS